MEFIDLKTQYACYKSEVKAEIDKVLESTQFIMGDQIPDLEEKLARYVGVEHCIATSSGTDSLLLALMAINLAPGDEVICVPYTWVSPVEVVCRLGAKPVFVDIDAQTGLIDVTKIESHITEKTKAIIPVSLYGQMPDFVTINKIARRYNLMVIEDGAQSFGAEQNGVKSGAVTHIGVTSFFPTKTFGCYGDGGAIFTNDALLAEKMSALRVHGAPERYNHQYIGMNGRIDTLQAAILLAKFPHLEDELEKRIEVAQMYDQSLQGVFETLTKNDGNKHVYSLYCLKSDRRDEVVSYLKEYQIPCAVYYPVCIHQQPAYKYLGYQKGDFPNAEELASKVFSIPMHPWLSKDDQVQVISRLKSSILQIA